MNIQQKTIIKAASVIAALLFLTNSFPTWIVYADSLPEDSFAPQEAFLMSEEEVPQETASPTDEMNSEEESVTEESIAQNEAFLQETTDITQDIAAEEKIMQFGETASQEQEAVTKEAEPLAFQAGIEYSPEGYRVMGTFTEFPPDIVQIQPLYSENNKSYQECGVEWDLEMIEAYHIAESKRLICLYFNNEPLKSYLDGSLDRFYLKLRLTGKNDILYETQTVLIDRGAPQPLPEEITPSAWFASNIRVRQIKPLRYYGRYQITVKETAASKEISAVLPDTLPVEVQFMKGKNPYATGIIDCPVTWKPLSLPSLTAGESVVIEDVAEEIIIPAGTSVRTPLGVFRLDESLSIESEFASDEVRLVLNVVSKDEKPTGALTAERDGLELAFHLKPTGAASIQAYVISENEEKWQKLPERYELALLNAVDAQPSTANSGYALVLDNEQEPYRSYLAAQAQETQPTPFFVGLKIKGGVYDGQELILAYPNTYEKPLNLPKFGGMGGNEGNAGAANKGDSTPEGQRPSLPQNSDTKKEGKKTAENITAENTTLENTTDLSAQPDLQDQQNIKNRQAAATLTQPPDKGQTANAAISGENASETATAAIDDTQTEIQTESAAAAETLPAQNKLSAGLAPTNQTQKTNQAANTANRRWFLWIIAAAVIGFGTALYIRRTKGQTDKKS